MKKMKKNLLPDLLSAVAKETSLYLPIKWDDGKTRYSEYFDGAVYSDALKTVRSAKDFFLPQVENISKYKVSGGKIEVIDEARKNEDFIVFGVRGCDCASFDLMDRVFLADPVDTFYEERRNHATIVTVACSRPGQSCFCGTFDIDASEPGGDATVWFSDDEIYIKPNSEKGERFVSLAGALLDDCDDSCADGEKEKIKDNLARLPLAGLKPDDARDRMMEVFNSEKWEKLSESCLGCGSCTFVCPTCQCYDIKEFKATDGTVHRFTCWDSCMYSDFTLMAGGQPRTTQLQRFRQRFMHKLVYYPMNNDGLYLCVGCGRCLESCPINMNIVKVMKALKEGKNEA